MLRAAAVYGLFLRLQVWHCALQGEKLQRQTPEGIGKSNGLCHRLRPPTPCHPAATLPADARVWGRPARPAPAAGPGWEAAGGAPPAPPPAPPPRCGPRRGPPRPPRASGWPALDAAGRPPARTAAHGQDGG